MIVHTCFNNSSEHGYKSSVLKSGICKYMRRDEKEKMKWCVMEMAHFQVHPKGQGLITNLINRLRILLMEEISFHETVITSYCGFLLDLYDKNRSDFRLLYSFCDIVSKTKRNRCVSYMNSWWRGRDFTYDKSELDKVLTYKKKGDTDECLLIGENLIHFIETKDERMFGCFAKFALLDKQGLRWRRKDASYLWFEILEEYMDTDDLKYLFTLALTQFHRKNMVERYAFGNWIGLMIWKREHLTESQEGVPYKISSKEEAERYMKEMTKLDIDSYVINDHHVNGNKFGLGHFAMNGAFVKDEYLDLLDNYKEKKEWYIEEKKNRDKGAKEDKPKEVKPKKDKPKEVKPKKEVIKGTFTDNYYLKLIDWSKFTDVNVLEDGVCGGKVCCISVMYEGKKYILKEMGPSMNYGKDYILIDKCKKVFGLKDMNMVRILSNRGQLKIDPSKKSYVNNVKIGEKKCVYCMMDYIENMGDLGKNKEMMKLTSYSDPTDLFVKKEALKIRLFDGLFRSSDNILRNILVIPGGELLSIDEGDIYGKRVNVFNKNDWMKDNCSQEEFKGVFDDLLSDGGKKLKVVKGQIKHYGFSDEIYETFEKRFINYRDIVIEEVF